ncbi:MAG TPA: DUF1801 domain-containing protein [Thermoanaerobaculia bacterium]|nr:DUF1801 domain-containing protein [Thermoanaerobaculia bacterium]
MPPSEERRLASFFAEYEPAVAAIGEQAVAKMLALLPGAWQLVYDNYNALVIAFAPTERTSQAILSIALYPRWVNLFFLRGALLPDPAGVLAGSGKSVRSIRLSAAADLDRAEVRALIGSALREAGWKPDASSNGRLVIKTVAAKRRARRPS